MGKWRYYGLDKNGKSVYGELQAYDGMEVRKMLRAQGVRVKRIVAPGLLEIDLGQWLVDKGFSAPFSTENLRHFTRQFAILVDAGVPILQALEVLYKQEQNITLKVAIKKIADEVSSGRTLSDAMAKQKGFDKLYCNLVRAGEAGGILDTILNKIAEYMERHEKIKSQIKSAMTYPAFVIVIGIAVIYVLLVFVIPKFTEMLKEGNQQIPAVTQLVIDTSKWLQSNTIIVLPAMFLALVFFLKWKKSDVGKPVWDRIAMNIPLMGGIVIKGNLASFSRTLGTMLGAGVSLIDSLDICAETVDNSVMSEDIRKVRAAVTEGKTLTEPLKKISYFPEMVAQMIKVGEQTGKLDQMLYKIAELFENEVSALIGAMTKMIEPLIIVVLGGIIAVLLIAMYLPIFMSAGGQGAG